MAFNKIPIIVNFATLEFRYPNAVSQMKNPISPPQANDIQATSGVKNRTIANQIRMPCKSPSRERGSKYQGVFSLSMMLAKSARHQYDWIHDRIIENR